MTISRAFWQPDRRHFLKMGVGLPALMGGFRSVMTTAEAAISDLTIGPAQVSLVGEGYPETSVWAFNGTVPGPVIRARQGDRLEITVLNELAEPTTVHWHGLRVPVGMDGVPFLSQPPIDPGRTFTYAFDLKDAGTFWYHPHFNSSEQVGRGLYGALIVDELEPPAVDRELIWVLDDWRLDRDAALAPFGNRHDMSHAGRIGNSATINGTIRERETVRAGERVRLRLINAANARTFGLTFRDLDPWIMSLDGQPVTPRRLGHEAITLGAGMRADLILDMTGDPGSESLVVDGHYGTDYAYELIRLTYESADPIEAGGNEPPRPIAPNPIAEPDLASAMRHRLVFAGGAMGGMNGAMMGGQMMSMQELAEKGRLWAINDVVPEDIYREPSLLHVERGSSNLVELVNNSAFEHPIHVHGHTFRVLSRNGKAVPGQPFRDTVLLGVDETVEIAFVADNPGKWMIHCHVLEHQSSGMMGVVEVI